MQVGGGGQLLKTNDSSHVALHCEQSKFLFSCSRKHFFPGSGRYSVVPASSNNDAGLVAVENGHLLSHGGRRGEVLPALLQKNAIPATSEEIDETTKARSPSSSAAAPVTKKMRWKLGRKRTITQPLTGGPGAASREEEEEEDDKVAFSEEDLDVPREGLFKKHRARKPNVQIQVWLRGQTRCVL